MAESCPDDWTDDNPQRITYQECMSTHEYVLKYCSTCHVNKCCVPRNVTSVEMTFNCRGVAKTLLFALVRSCECHSSHC